MIFKLGLYVSISIIFIFVIHQLVNHIYNNFTKPITRDLQHLNLQYTTSNNETKNTNIGTLCNDTIQETDKHTMKNELKNYFKQISNSQKNDETKSLFLVDNDENNTQSLFDSYSLQNNSSQSNLQYSSI